MESTKGRFLSETKIEVIVAIMLGVTALFSAWDNGDTDKNPNLPSYLRSGAIDNNTDVKISRFGNEGTGIQSMMAAAERIFEVLNEEEEIDRKDKKKKRRIDDDDTSEPGVHKVRKKPIYVYSVLVSVDNEDKYINYTNVYLSSCVFTQYYTFIYNKNENGLKYDIYYKKRNFENVNLFNEYSSISGNELNLFNFMTQ